MSLVVPGTNGLTTRIDRLGHSCARAGGAAHSVAIATSAVHSARIDLAIIFLSFRDAADILGPIIEKHLINLENYRDLVDMFAHEEEKCLPAPLRLTSSCPR